MEQLGYKPYPNYRSNHTVIGATLAPRHKWNIAPSDVRWAQVRVPQRAYEVVCTSVEMSKAPKTIVQAQFSIPYTIATPSSMVMSGSPTSPAKPSGGGMFSTSPARSTASSGTTSSRTGAATSPQSLFG